MTIAPGTAVTSKDDFRGLIFVVTAGPDADGNYRVLDDHGRPHTAPDGVLAVSTEPGAVFREAVFAYAMRHAAPPDPTPGIAPVYAELLQLMRDRVRLRRDRASSARRFVSAPELTRDGGEVSA